LTARIRSRRGMPQRTLTIVCASVVSVLVVVGVAIAGGAASGQQVRVAQGRFSHHRWALKVQGRHDRRCYELWLRGKSVADAVGTCRPDKHRPPLWSRLVGITDDSSASVELNVTRTRVRAMRLRVGHPNSGRPPRWMPVHTRRISRSDARKAKIRRNFRFAVLHSRGRLCVKRVILFDRNGDRIDDRRVPCEG
jgi:hypothetical protein